MKLSPTARSEVMRYIASQAEDKRNVVAFNFTRSLTDTSMLGRAVGRGADTRVLADLAAKGWRDSMEKGWTLELVGYAPEQVTSEEFHSVDGVCVFIPRDLEAFFGDKTIDFQGGEFLLTTNAAGRTPMP